MEQYLKLLREIKEKGTVKPAAREGMPSTLSLFGYQFRHNLADGFPLLTTKKMYWKGIVTELLWFLRGDTNIKYLVDNGCNIWNEDAYNYYKKRYPKSEMSFEQFIDFIKNPYFEGTHALPRTLQFEDDSYKLGDCGYQYGKVWRKWQGEVDYSGIRSEDGKGVFPQIDQIANVIKSLKQTPESRRHIVTAIDPAHDQDLALYWCHAMFQFNCRPLTDKQQFYWLKNKYGEEWRENITEIPKYYLDCQLYQRSADVFLGVPFNIASYALLIHIIAKICNMIPGEFIHTFGDVHIYENHMDAVNEQLSRTPRELPKLIIPELDWNAILKYDFETLIPDYFKIEGYNPYPAIKAELTTGMKK